MLASGARETRQSDVSHAWKWAIWPNWSVTIEHPTHPASGQPGTGAANETGQGSGLGWTRNVPVPFGISRKEFLEQFTAAVEKAADQVRPELVLLSAGFDAHRRDPVGGLCLEAEDFGDMTRILRSVARVHCGDRLVSCLEGGYHLDALRDSVVAHVRELLGPV